MMRSLLVIAFLCLPMEAAAQRVSVAPEFVASAVGRAVNVSAADVTVLSSVVARGKEPAFEVMRIERFDSQRNRVRVRCREANMCLPFYALINAGNGAQPVSAGKAEPLLQRGAHVTLLFTDGRMRIVVPVITLEPGIKGQPIRVGSGDHKHIWTAEVMSAEVVKGSL